MTMIPDLSVLNAPLYQDDYEYIRDHAPQYLERVELALKGGASPQRIFDHYMQIAPHRYQLWLRLKHAACHLQESGE